MAGILTISEEINFAFVSNLGASFPAAELACSGGTEGALMEFGVTVRGLGSTSFGLGRTTTPGVARFWTYAANDDPDGSLRTGVGASRLAVAWTTIPGPPVQYLRRGTMSAIGQGVIWHFPTGLIYNTTNTLVLQSQTVNTGTPNASSWWVINE